VLSDDPIISKVLLRYKFWPKRQDFVPPIERVPLADELQPHVPRETKKLNLLHYVRMIPHFYTIIKGVAMSNWKTTVTGVVKLVFFALGAFGISTGNLTEGLVLAACYAIVDAIQSYFTADANKGAK
jgi:hypothetical protein